MSKLGRGRYTTPYGDCPIQQGDDNSCPSGMCIAHRAEQLTGAFAHTDSLPEDDRRIEAQCQPMRREPARMGDGRIEVIMQEDHRSWLDVLIGRK